MSHPTSLSHINIWLLLLKLCNGKATRLQLVLDCGITACLPYTFIVILQFYAVNASCTLVLLGITFVLWCNFQSLPNCQWAHAQITRSLGLLWWARRTSWWLPDANLMIVGVALFAQVEPVQFIFILLSFFGFPFVFSVLNSHFFLHGSDFVATREKHLQDHCCHDAVLQSTPQASNVSFENLQLHLHAILNGRLKRECSQKIYFG